MNYTPQDCHTNEHELRHLEYDDKKIMHIANGKKHIIAYELYREPVQNSLFETPEQHVNKLEYLW